MAFDPVLDAVLRAALDATAAIRGWVVARDGERLRVVAAAGVDEPGRLLDRETDAHAGTAGLVTASGQPMAIVPREGDPTVAQGVAGMVGVVPQAVLCVPCGDDEVLGAIELVDKHGGGGFTFDDVEVATLLAGVAGAALATREPARAGPTAAELAATLTRLEHDDPGYYATVAPLVSALLDRG